jgi:hypothetical protein
VPVGEVKPSEARNETCPANVLDCPLVRHGAERRCTRGGASVDLKRWVQFRRAGSTARATIVVLGHFVPRGRLVPAQCVNVRRIGVDSYARLGKINLLLQLDQAREP